MVLGGCRSFHVLVTTAENVDSNELRIRLNSSTLSSQVVRYHNGQQYHQNIFQIHYRDFGRLGNTFTKEILCFTMNSVKR